MLREYTFFSGVSGMDQATLIFFQRGPTVRLSDPEIVREIVWGEDVEGLIDLPVREIIDRVKTHFPKHEERPGIVVVQTSGGSFQMTWTWQHVRVDLSDVSDSDRQQLTGIIESFGCRGFDPQKP
jgi:hypothetical protein